jgi:uncharacterized caspase-like protein
MTIADGQNTSGRAINVKLDVEEAPADQTHPAGSGVQDVRLFRNGSLVKIWRGDALQGRGAATLEFTLPLAAGENRLTAYAFNRNNVKSADETRTVVGNGTLARGGTLYILAVGVDKYANKNFDLKLAVADAVTFSEELSSKQAELGRFARIEVVTLFDEEATKANLVAALARLSGATEARLPTQTPAFPNSLEKLKPALPEDMVIVYFAGHGVAHEARFYLIPHDLGYAGMRNQPMSEAEARDFLAHGVSDVELERLFEGVDASQLLFIIDACNSGQAIEAQDKRSGPMNSKGLAQLAYEKGMNILTASQGDEFAYEDTKLGHGNLIYALFEEGIKKMAADTRPRDGQVMLREWLNYATEEVPRVQEARLREKRGLKLKLDSDEKNQPPPTQRPRVFYRREAEIQQLIVAKPK